MGGARSRRLLLGFEDVRPGITGYETGERPVGDVFEAGDSTTGERLLCSKIGSGSVAADEAIVVTDA